MQILNPKPQTLPHDKSKLGYCSSTSKIHKEDRKVCFVYTLDTLPSFPLSSSIILYSYTINLLVSILF
jgi:hypothetical protein